MKNKLIFLVSLFLMSGFELSAQNLCPLYGEYCDGKLKLFYPEGVSPIPSNRLLFGKGDQRNGIYQSTTFGSNWIEVCVDAQGVTSLIVIVDDVFSCQNIPVTEVCPPNLCKECPEEIINHEAGKLCLTFENPPPFIMDKVSFDFGEGDTKNGTYDAIYLSSDTLQVNVPPSFCCDELSCDITIGSIKCTMTENNFEVCHSPPVSSTPQTCTCGGLLEECQQDLITYLNTQMGNSTCQQWLTDCNLTSSIYRMGKVGIHTTDVPSGFSLAVKEGITANRIIVELCETGQWCDYVFEDNYPLTSLDQVAHHIKTYGYLHHSPSAQEIEQQGGFEMKATKLMQQEKIEEIFLHLINMNKEIEVLEAHAALLERENRQLKKRKRY